MFKLVLIRHGESLYNKANKWCGWTDVELSERGEEEARSAGRMLKQEGYKFDIVFCNVLKRAKHTTRLVLEEMSLEIPVEYDWRLNERHYGALQGVIKSEMTEKVGEEQVHIWRRGYDVRPPAVTKEDPRWPGNDPKYAHIPKSLLPFTECLKDTLNRVMPYWHERIVPAIKSGKRVLISASGNSLRAIVKYLDNMPDDVIPGLNIPTGIPLVYELDDGMRPVRHYYLGDPEKVRVAIKEVANQAKLR